MNRFINILPYTAFRRLMSVVCLTAAVAFSMLASTAPGKWTVFTAFDETPLRIIDTEKKTYFIVHQQMYNSTLDCYKMPYVGAFALDKNNASATMVPLRSVADVPGSSIMLSDYNPVSGTLVLVHADSRVSLISDSGETSVISLPVNEMPGAMTFNRLTICGGEAWIATANGYHVVDCATGVLKRSARLGKNVTGIARVADRIVLFADDTAYDAPAAPLPASFSQFSPLSITGTAMPATIQNAAGTLVQPDGMMPVGESSVAFFAPKKETGTFSACVIYREDDAWKGRFITDLWLPVVGASNIVANKFERHCMRNKAGYLFFTGDKLWQFDESAKPTEWGFLTQIPSSRSISIAGSWNLSSVWTYADRGCFIRGTRNEAGTSYIWNEDPVRPNAPACFIADRMEYSPKHGLLAVNFGYNSKFPAYGNYRPPLLSALKNGVWTLPNPTYNAPESTIEDATLANLYKSKLTRFPISDPSGLKIDPRNPDFVWMGSSFCGMAAINLGRPTENPIHLGSPSDDLAAFPGFYAALPLCDAWKSWATVSTPDFDPDGRLWAVYNNYQHYIDGDETIALRYWEAPNRTTVLTQNDVSKIDKIGEFYIPGSSGIQSQPQIIALKHRLNKNRVAVFEPSVRRVHILNHKGTVDDTSDDTYSSFDRVRDQGGNVFKTDLNMAWAEDPASGMLWFATGRQLIYVNPRDVADNYIMPGKHLMVTYGKSFGNPFDSMQINCLTFDDRDRMWISTMGNGLWLLSADRNSILAHYTTDNSAIPSNEVYGLAWNPEEGSLLVSTTGGMALLSPDIPGDDGLYLSRPAVMPQSVGPEFSGFVRIMNLQANTPVSIRDREGNTVRSIFSDTEGIARWYVDAADGSRIPAGIYYVCSDAATFPDTEIVVL